MTHHKFKNGKQPVSSKILLKVDQFKKVSAAETPFLLATNYWPMKRDEKNESCI